VLLDAGDLPIRLRLQAGHCLRLGSPLYAELLRRAADDAEAGGSVAELLHGHEGDPVDSMLALRLMGAVHRRVLEGALPELEPFYLSSGVLYDRIAGKRNTARADEAWRAFRRAVAGDAEEIRQLLDRPLQTNEVGRCAALLPGFLAIAQETGMPLRLLEVGASAGLNLRWDRYRYEADGFSWGEAGSPVRLRFQIEGEPSRRTELEVAERRGCDRSPIDPTSDEGRLTLLSCLWPDQAHRVERTRAALDLAAEVAVAIDRGRRRVDRGAAGGATRRGRHRRLPLDRHAVPRRGGATGVRGESGGGGCACRCGYAPGLVAHGARRRAGGGPADGLAGWRG
jgi:hypothetical protein